MQAAAGGGHLAVVNRLLEYNANLNAHPSVSGQTALQGAAEGGYVHIVNRLIELGADVNEGPAEFGGLTALQAAAGGRHLDICEYTPGL